LLQFTRKCKISNSQIKNTRNGFWGFGWGENDYLKYCGGRRVTDHCTLQKIQADPFEAAEALRYPVLRTDFALIFKTR
jgi:hypothetical protein